MSRSWSAFVECDRRIRITGSYLSRSRADRFWNRFHVMACCLTHQAISSANVDFSSKVLCGLRTLSQEMLRNRSNMYLEITHLKSLPLLPEINEWTWSSLTKRSTWRTLHALILTHHNRKHQIDPVHSVKFLLKPKHSTAHNQYSTSYRYLNNPNLRASFLCILKTMVGILKFIALHEEQLHHK